MRSHLVRSTPGGQPYSVIEPPSPVLTGGAHFHMLGTTQKTAPGLRTPAAAASGILAFGSGSIACRVNLPFVGSLARLAVLLRVTHPVLVALDLHVDVGIVRALGRRAGADFDEHGVLIGRCKRYKIESTD